MEPLRRYSLFVCPILSGSGVRVKLLEAFASGIPVVSTTIGAEGLAATDGEICGWPTIRSTLRDSVARLLTDQAAARDLAVRARKAVVDTRDMRTITQKLEQSYRMPSKNEALYFCGFKIFLKPVDDLVSRESIDFERMSFGICIVRPHDGPSLARHQKDVPSALCEGTHMHTGATEFSTVSGALPLYRLPCSFVSFVSSSSLAEGEADTVPSISVRTQCQYDP